MSPSSIDGSIVVPSSRQTPAVGIAIGRRGVTAIELDGSRNGGKPIIVVSESMDVDLARPLTEQSATSLAEALKKIAAGFSHRYLPAHVLLPDPLVEQAVFELDQAPPGGTERDDFGAWRMEKALHFRPAHCTTQLLGERSGKTLLFASGIGNPLYQAMTSAFEAAGCVPWTIEAISVRAFNCCEAHFGPQGSGLVALSSDCWSVWHIDPHGNPRNIRSRWRGGEDAAEIERTIVAWSLIAPEPLAKLVVFSVTEDDPLISVLRSRVVGEFQVVRWERVRGDVSTEASEARTLELAVLAAQRACN